MEERGMAMYHHINYHPPSSPSASSSSPPPSVTQPLDQLFSSVQAPPYMQYIHIHHHHHHHYDIIQGLTTAKDGMMEETYRHYSGHLLPLLLHQCLPLLHISDTITTAHSGIIQAGIK